MKFLIKIGLLALLIFAASGCKPPVPSKGGVKQGQLTKDATLEKPDNIKSLSDINSIAFEWKTIKDTRVAGIYIYRGETGKESLSRVGEIKSRYATHYVDFGLNPNSDYVYRFSTYSDEDLESLPSQPIAAKTRDILGPVTFIEALKDLPSSAKIVFKPHSNQRIEKYEIQRRTPTKPEWETIDTVKGRLTAEYINTELEHGKFYEYRVFGITYDGIKTYPSKVVSAKTRKLPDMVKGLKVTTDKPKYVGLTWEKTSEDININYNIYRSEKARGPYKLVKKNWAEPAIKDEVAKDGEIYFYKITAVDEYGLESLKQTIGVQGSTLAKPKPPYITFAAVEDGSGHIKWESGDTRADTFVIYRKVRKGLFGGAEDQTEQMTTKDFTDAGLELGSKITYSVVAIDEFGIMSEPSEPVTLTYTKDKK